MRFGFFLLTPFSFNIARDYVMATALALRGDKVIIVGCDGQPRCFLKIADPPGTDPQARCEGCANGVKMLYRHAFGSFQGEIEGVVTSRLVDTGRRDAAWQELDRADADALRRFRFAGMPMGEWAVDNLRAEYVGERWSRLPDWPDRLREWLKGGVTAALTAERFIHIVKPDAVVVLNGIPVAERAVVTTAQLMGVRCLTWEDGPVPQTMIMRDHDLAVHYNFDPEWTQWQVAPLTAAESRQLDLLLHRRWFRSSKADYVWSTALGSGEDDVLARLELPADRPVVAAFTNVLGDTSVFHVQRAYGGLIEWLQAVIDYARQRPEVSVIVRIHPAELDMLGIRRFSEETTLGDSVMGVLEELGIDLPANCRFIAPGDRTSSYALLQIARVALVYASSIGMEAAAMGIPVVAAGKAHYADAGFTWPIIDGADFMPTVDRLVAAPTLPADAVAKARRYLYLWFFRVGCELPFLPQLRHLEKHPDGLPGMFKGYEAIRGYAESAPPGLERLARFARGEAPFLAPPPSWRIGTTDGNGPTLAALPDWQRLEAFFDTVASVIASHDRVAVLLVVEPAFAEEARHRLATTQHGIASRCDVVSPEDRPAAQGRLLAQARALLLDRGVEPGSLAETAKLLEVPILRLDSDTWTCEAMDLIDATVDQDLATIVRPAVPA
jgi:hypothetical protein